VGINERRQREKQEMRELILAAALRLFAEESFERTTMRRIAEVIEYTPGTIYGYFKDKSEILYALHVRGFEELVARMEAALVGVTAPGERLGALGRAYIRFAFDNPIQYDLMFLSKTTAKKILADAEWDCGERAYGLLRNEVRGFLEHHHSTVDPEVATFTCWSTVHGMVALVIRDRCIFFPTEALPAIVDAAFQQYLTMMTTAAPALTHPPVSSPFQALPS
jgi:AcrR family transcriptional regulator